MQAGTRVGQFELLEVIGRGGMGEVWRARDTRLERDVAMKTLPARYIADADAISRLAREARVLAALNHPNIATLLGLEEQDGQCWLVLELVEGATLEDRLAAGKLALQEAIDIALQVCEALQTAHSRGIIHCDLKASNIKFDSMGRVKVLDFGIAQSLQGAPKIQQTTLTAPPASEETAGTPSSMSPEQIRGETVGPASDIWAFGVLLYRMLSGRLPFAGPTRADTLALVLQSEPDLSLLRPHVPEALVRLVRRCLEKEPRLRIQHAADLHILIEEAVHPASPTVPRRVGLAIAAMVIGALIAGGLLWHYQAGTDAASPPASVSESNQASIAVLPFVNMSADPEQEYFSDGLSEELINQLSHIEGLRVTARTSAFSFKGKSQDLRAVGQALGVANLLEGSVRKAGGQVRITAQLINATTGYHIWSETFDRKLDDVIAIQDEIATSVASKLGLSLGLATRMTDYGGTQSLAAYDHLLRGLTGFGTFSSDSTLAAIAEYRAALAIDPNYARAAAELAIAMGARTATGFYIPGPERDEATALAIRLAPDAPLTHVASMWLQSDRHQWLAADNSCRAVFLAGHDPRAEWICAGFLTLTGRVRAATPYREAGRRADPLSMVVAATLVRHYAILGMGAQMRKEVSRVTGTSGAARQMADSSLAYMAHTGASRAQMSEELDRLCTNVGSGPACRAWTTAVRTPQRARAELRSQLRSISVAIEAGPIALAAAYVGDTSLALDAIETFTSIPSTPGYQNLWYPLLANARKEARFKQIMRSVGLVELWRRTGQWADVCHPVGVDDFECS